MWTFAVVSPLAMLSAAVFVYNLTHAISCKVLSNSLEKCLYSSKIIGMLPLYVINARGKPTR